MSTDAKTIDTSDAGLASLLLGFESCTVTEAEWTHHAHVLVALQYVMTCSDPLTKMRDGIHRLLQAFGIVTTDMRGYHETITSCYIAALCEYVQNERKRNPEAALRPSQLAEGAIQLATRELPLSYYSKERLFGAEARYGFVPPDLRPLPPLL